MTCTAHIEYNGAFFTHYNVAEFDMYNQTKAIDSGRQSFQIETCPNEKRLAAFIVVP